MLKSDEDFYFDLYLKQRVVRHRGSVVLYAIKKGKLKRKPCFLCGAKRVHAHHPDYTKVLKIRWLCPKCHQYIHRLINVVKEFFPDDKRLDSGTFGYPGKIPEKLPYL